MTGNLLEVVSENPQKRLVDLLYLATGLECLHDGVL